MINKKKIKVSVLGATGMVGQRFITLLEKHPWFEIIDVAASKSSENKSYYEAVKNKWVLNKPIPEFAKKFILRHVEDFEKIPKKVEIVFSAIDLSQKKDTRNLEIKYAKHGYALISTSSASRKLKKVPMIIPEINHDHLKIIKYQQKFYNLPKSGFICVKPNCSIQSYIFAIDALEKANYKIKKIQATTLQALSGAGYKAMKDKNLKQNVIPFIKNEEEKTEIEPLKIFGSIKRGSILNSNRIKINATCTRVPVIDGHTAIVHISFKNKIPSLKKFKKILTSYSSLPQILKLPSAPLKPIHLLDNLDRPQPKIDINLDKGMALSIGRIEKDPFFDIRFIGLSHNTLRGAAGGAILNAELIVKGNYI